MSKNYIYASLGESCQTSMDMLVSNNKFITPTDQVYKLGLTKMKQYPAEKVKNKSLPSLEVNIQKKGCC
jgi:hypothetical protein